MCVSVCVHTHDEYFSAAMMKQFEELLRNLSGQHTRELNDQYLERESEFRIRLREYERLLSERDYLLSMERTRSARFEKQFENELNREVTALKLKNFQQQAELDELKQEIRNGRTSALEGEQVESQNPNAQLDQNLNNDETAEREKQLFENERELERLLESFDRLGSENGPLTSTQLRETKFQQRTFIEDESLTFLKENKNVASYQNKYREMRQKSGGVKEDKINGEAWRKTANHMLQQITTKTADSNPEATEKVCKTLGQNFPGSSWFVYIMKTRKNWVWKVNRGDFQRWMGHPGRPACDLAIWGMICPDEISEIGHYSDLGNTMVAIMTEGQKCLNANTALEKVVTLLNEKEINWSFVFVASNKITSRTMCCVADLFFTEKSKFQIDVYLGL